jgi:uncharacterized membrane protein
MEKSCFLPEITCKLLIIKKVTMFDLPLHPLVVHFPIVLGVLLPLVGFLFWWGIKKEIVPQKVWVLVVAFAFVYSVSAIVAIELGENDEEKVEEVVSGRVIEEHEEAGEAIPWGAGGLFLVSLLGYVRKNSNIFQLALGVLSLIAIFPLAEAGHTGGELVYRYGAAIAHLPSKQQIKFNSGDFKLGTYQSSDKDKDRDKDKDHDKKED